MIGDDASEAVQLVAEALKAGIQKVLGRMKNNNFQICLLFSCVTGRCLHVPRAHTHTCRLTKGIPDIRLQACCTRTLNGHGLTLYTESRDFALQEARGRPGLRRPPVGLELTTSFCQQLCS